MNRLLIPVVAIAACTAAPGAARSVKVGEATYYLHINSDDGQCRTRDLKHGVKEICDLPIFTHDLNGSDLKNRWTDTPPERSLDVPHSEAECVLSDDGIVHRGEHQGIADAPQWEGRPASGAALVSRGPRRTGGRHA